MPQTSHRIIPPKTNGFIAHALRSRGHRFSSKSLRLRIGTKEAARCGGRTGPLLSPPALKMLSAERGAFRMIRYIDVAGCTAANESERGVMV
jgi:hypothetical protein